MLKLTAKLWLVPVLALLSSAPLDARTLQDVLNTGTLRVGLSLAPPWAMRSADGALIGYEVDLAEKLAADLGVKAEFVFYEWNKLVFAIETHEVDIVAAGLTITPERALHVNFSDPHTTGGISLATNVARTSQVERLEQLDDAQFRFGAVEGTTAVSLARRLLPRAQLQEFENAETAGNALIEGEIDGYLEQHPVPGFLALKNPGSIDVPLGRPLLESHAAFAVAKGDHDFVFYLNAWIVARRADTWLPTTQRYWFETLRWQDRIDDGGRR